MVKDKPMNNVPSLIVIGGSPGSGKTTISSKLSYELGIPRLSSDAIGHTIKDSVDGIESRVDAFRIAYDILFALCGQFVADRVSVVLDLTLGWEFHWKELDKIVNQNPQVLFLPIILYCPYDQCLARIDERHKTTSKYEASDFYTTAMRLIHRQQKVLDVWDYLQNLKRPEVSYVDANKDEDQVYKAVRECVMSRIG